MELKTTVGQKSDYSRKKLDLTGQRFGKLTVLAPAENVGTRTAWLCQCECGNKVVKKTVHLRSGHVTTCGCEGIAERLTLVNGTCLEMLRSKAVRKNNSSGVTGVDRQKGTELWRATICFQGKRYYLGRFAHFEDAVKARKEAEIKLHDTFVEQYSKGSLKEI